MSVLVFALRDVLLGIEYSPLKREAALVLPIVRTCRVTVLVKPIEHGCRAPVYSLSEAVDQPV